MRKYIRNEREDKIYLPDRREKIFREEQQRETERERDENSERLWPLVLQKPYPTRTKKIVFKVFIFF